MGAAGGAQQQQVTAAVAAVLAAGRVPLPDRQADVKAKADDRRLVIELGGHKLERQVQRRGISSSPLHCLMPRCCVRLAACQWAAFTSRDPGCTTAGRRRV